MTYPADGPKRMTYGPALAAIINENIRSNKDGNINSSNVYNYRIIDNINNRNI